MNVCLKRVIGCVMLLTLSMALMPVSALAANSDVFEISTAEELWEFAGKVNGGQTSLNAKLMDDIVFNENVLDADGYLNTGDYDITDTESSMSLEEGDKIMLWDNLDVCIPLCNGYTLK